MPPREKQRPPQQQGRQPGIENEMQLRPKAEDRAHRAAGKLQSRVALITGETVVLDAQSLSYSRKKALTSRRARPYPQGDKPTDQAHNRGEYTLLRIKAITLRLEQLDREWDIERTLEANAAFVGLLGLALCAFVNRKWFALPAVVSGFLLQHAVQGRCPPVSLFRRLGVRTRDEIDYERYALKLLRGDFKEAPQEEVLTLSDANQLLKAAER